MLLTYWSQCLYIRSLITIPVALGKSASFACIEDVEGTSMISITLRSSGEKAKPLISFDSCESCLRSLPSVFIIHTWEEPLSLLKKAIFSPFCKNAGFVSFLSLCVSNFDCLVFKSIR